MDNNIDNEKLPTAKEQRSGGRRIALLAAGTGLGAVLSYLFVKVVRALSADAGSRDLSRRQVPDHIVDDQGTGQEKAARILLNLRDRAFEASDEKLALALGRPVEEVVAWNEGLEIIDDDVVMKARGIAMHRGVHVE